MKSRDLIQYDKDYILNNLSKSEVDGGITSVSFYDENYATENITPFFRIKINDSTFKNDSVNCLFEWIACKDFERFIKDNFLLKKILIYEVELVYCLFYNQTDTFQQTQSSNGASLKNKIIGDNNWGKCEVVNGIKFIAAPIMYFGKGYGIVMPIDQFLKLNNARIVSINNHNIVEVKLFDLIANPSENRKWQRNYWEKMSLEKVLEEYKTKTRIDFTFVLKRRSELFKKMNK